MRNYGVNGNINWPRHFFTQVVIEGELFESVTVDARVPQGTVLGPLVFMCHMIFQTHS